MYYIYFWFNIHTNEIFYIGIGHGHRRFMLKKRNELFKKYYRENQCAVRLYQMNLGYDEARELEVRLIEELNPCCNITLGGEKTNGALISEKLKGRSFSDEHRRNLSIAAKKQWKEQKFMMNNKSVAVLDKDRNLIKAFEAKYHVGVWLHNEYGYGRNERSAQRKADKYFKSEELFDGRFYFIEITS